MPYSMYLDFCKNFNIKAPLSEEMYDVVLKQLLNNEPALVEITKAEFDVLVKNTKEDFGVNITLASEDEELTPESIVKILKSDLDALMAEQKPIDFGAELNDEVPHNLIVMDEDNIGDIVVDRFTKFGGILISVLYGEDDFIQGEVQPQCENQTKLPKSEWFEISRLELKNVK